MSEGLILEIGQNAIYTVLLVVAPVLGAGLMVGLMVAIFQATTQIQEQTLAFVPKIFAVLGALALLGSWIMRTVVEYSINLFSNLALYIGG
ncbi:flagellar biosynthesis protein FliQ [Halanaerobium sp. Z-7514]|uniref:Flagellar biosynthetic protein FliQ n=1 Tax=Halanaerobium polyolivorans TaxID=2886943 RepID=A0AAW4WZU9_9FIRM|nr:flagellar biosynthesis protein FliQ [Halanaerobium polyolivorans]MCC3145192.1 flagellar biosynthesis protein FliQ [Halanaerobium polyolivorans]